MIQYQIDFDFRLQFQWLDVMAMCQLGSVLQLFSLNYTKLAINKGLDEEE